MAKVAKKAVTKSSKPVGPRAKPSKLTANATTPTTKSKASASAKHKKETAKKTRPAIAKPEPVKKKAAKKSVKPRTAGKIASASPTKRKAVTKPAKKTAEKAKPKSTPAKIERRGPAKAVKAPKSRAKGKAVKINSDEVIKEFRNVVNLKADQLERWLSLPDSKKLGFKDEVNEGTVGHESGKRILKILSKRRDKYTDDDLRHMQTVVGFVRRHKKEKPPGDVFASNWRYSLMNWGHDPIK